VSRQVVHQGRAHAEARSCSRASSGSSRLQVLSFVSLAATVIRAGQRRIVKSRAVRRVVSSVVAMLAVAMIPTCLLAQRSDSTTPAAGIQVAASARGPAPAGQIPRFFVFGKPVRAGSPPPQRTASRDSLRNGAVVCAVIGAAALGAFAGSLCHAYREKGGASCAPDAIRFAAIGGAIGLGAGIAIDVARNSSPMVRLSIAF
jgi:hypothetical protein